MAKFSLFIIILLLPFQLLVGQSLNWEEIIKGRPEMYRKYKITAAESYREDTLIRKAVYNIDANNIIFLDKQLDTLYIIQYDKKDRPIKIVRKGRTLFLKYLDETEHVYSMSVSIHASLVDTVRTTWLPYPNRQDIAQNEVYVINRPTNDTLSKNIKGYIINEADSANNYIRELDNKKEIKKYPNQDWITATTTFYGNYYSYDSLVPVTIQGKRKYHHYYDLVYPDSTIQTISKDSTYIKKIINNKLVYINTSISGKTAYEVFYNADSAITQKILYKYYPDYSGNDILWEIITYNEAGKRIKTAYPTKRYYKLKKGKLKRKARKFPETDLISCEGSSYSIFEYDYRLWLTSSSLFFDYDVEGNKVGNYFLNIDLMQTLYTNNIIKENQEVYYDLWNFAYNNKDSSTVPAQIDYFANKITLPAKSYVLDEIPNQNAIGNNYIKLVTVNGKELRSPKYTNNEIDNLSHKIQVVIFNYLKRYRKSY